MATELEQIKTKKYALALHTTTPELGLAIRDFNGEARAEVWNLGRELSSHLHQYLIDFIQPQTLSDLAFIAVAKGPGGFTGTRIGLVAARTLGQQLKIPVFGISTLAAVAWTECISRIAPRKDQAIAVKMPAQRGQIFAAVYQPTPNVPGLTALLPDTVFKSEVLQETLANWYSNCQIIAAESGLAATVTSILELAYLDWQMGKRPHWSEALPYYGQDPVDI